MEKIIIRGGKRLKGKVKVHGAKNAVLPIIAGTLLNARGENEICDAPALKDVDNMIKMLEALGVRVSYENGHIITNAETIGSTEAPYELVRQMRASFLVMGPLLARMGEARIPLPGGCAIGTRPIDQHLKGFKAMGADIEMGQGYIEAKVNGRLQGATIYLDIASVGATENIMMAASLAEGHTVIENAAREPEVVDLANFLNNMGANIRGAGTGEIRIEGVDFLKGTTHTVIPDRIEAGTFLIAAAITRGSLFIEGALGDHIRPLIAKLEEMGVKITEIDEGIQVDAKGELTSTDVKTLPYPGFPTDMQAQMMALMLTVPGTSLISETVFENRFKHVEEFKRMRGNIKIDGRTAVVEGGQPLSGARVKATDLRAGAALILAGLVSEGETEVTELHHLDRGYVDFAEKLARLGADIERLPIEQQSEKSATELVIQPSYA